MSIYWHPAARQDIEAVEDAVAPLTTAYNEAGEPDGWFILTAMARGDGLAGALNMLRDRGWTIEPPA